MNNIRDEFPIFKKKPDLIYLDSSATSLKPQQVIEAITKYYSENSFNVYRSVYNFSAEVTRMYNDGRCIIASFIGATSDEVIFTSGATDSLNKIVSVISDFTRIDSRENILLTQLDHHSSLVPWLDRALKYNYNIVYIPLVDNQLTADGVKAVITRETRIVVIPYVSNTLGYITPVKEITKIAHAVGAFVILDAAQAMTTISIDVHDLDVDFMAFSGHKMFGPTGIGVLYGKAEILDGIRAFNMGGNNVLEVTETSVSLKEENIERLEAGTPNIEGVIGLAEAVKFIERIGIDNIHKQTMRLCQYLIEELKKIEDVVIYNESTPTPIVLFNVEGIHAHDVATILDNYRVCVRAGHHCAQLVNQVLRIDSSVRVSIGVYNTRKDIDILIEGIKTAVALFKE